MTDDGERSRRWTLALGVDPEGDDGAGGLALSDSDRRMADALTALYGDGGEAPKKGRGGLGGSAPRVARWLGDIREFFPKSVVQVIQKDAFERKGLRQMLLEPEFLATVEADVNLVADLVSLRGVMPEKTKETARAVIAKVVGELMERFPSVPSSRSFFVFQQVGGAIAKVPPAATAYANRNAAYDSFPVSIWTEPADDQANISWAREMYAALRPFAMDGVYVNNLGEEGDDRVKAAYGENYARLLALKRKYDPDNLFRLNQNIRPPV